jgi:hypothetical protein
MRRATMLTVVGIVLALAGVAYVRWDAFRRGSLSEREKPILEEIRLDAIKVTADSTEGARLDELIKPQAKVTERAVVKYLEGRVKVLALPDSAVPRVWVTNALDADTAVMELLRSNRLMKQRVEVDSSEKSGLREQLHDTETLNKILAKQAHPLCGQKCGIAVGAGATVLLLKVLGVF